MSRPPVPRLPPHAPGMRIGVFGGSFDPPHAGHLLVALTALRRLRLDRVWWLVTPGNPLKGRGPAPLARRLAAVRALARHPRFVVTGVEATLGTRYTADTLKALRRRAPGVRFVWIMGADGLAGFHRWDRWREIAATVPVAIIDRPGGTLKAAFSRAAVAHARDRWPEGAAGSLALATPPAWVMLHGPRSGLSSTALRGAAPNGPAPQP